VIQLGALDEAGGGLVAPALAAYALGLAGYAGLHLLTRASYAAGDTRTPALVNLGVAVSGSVLMLVLFGLVADSSTGRMVAIGVAHSAALMAGAVALGVMVRRRVGVSWPVGATLARSAAAAVAAGGAAWAVAGLVPSGGRLGAAVAVILGGAAGVGAYLLAAWALRAPELTMRPGVVALTEPAA
jgi:putative peptidoglycan lipid II flippase